MKLQISEMAKLAGVSVRTLHYYDEIGLLKPSEVDPVNGYRFYGQAALERLQEILFYRELAFPLGEIARLLSSPDYDKTQALSAQRHLLTLKKERLERLIAAIDDAAKGENTMALNAFQNTEYEAARAQYAKEARQKWGDTDAYRESEQKTKDYTTNQWQEADAGLNAVFAAFAACRKSGNAPDSEEAKAIAQRLQEEITRSYYTCTKEILAGLGVMYTEDERFCRNIDRNGEGTAAYARAAIEAYCN